MKGISEIALVLIYGGIIYTMVRPGSQGPGLVTATTGGLSNLLKTSMGAGNTWKA